MFEYLKKHFGHLRDSVLRFFAAGNSLAAAIRRNTKLEMTVLEDRLNPSSLIAAADIIPILHDSPANVSTPNLLTNDSYDAQNLPTVELVTNVSQGTLYLNQNYDPFIGWTNVPGGLHFVPPAGFVGELDFSYRLFDGTDYSNTVTVTLNVTNQVPTGLNDGVFEVHQGDTLNVTSANSVLLNDVDLDNDAISAVLVTNVSHG